MPRNENTTVRNFKEENSIRKSLALSDKRYHLPNNWYFVGKSDPDPKQFHNIEIVRLKEEDNYKNPPSIFVHWEGFGYDLFNANRRVFSNFKIKRTFKGKKEIRDFEPAVKHLICQAKAHDIYTSSEVDRKLKAQNTLDSCRVKFDLPDITLINEKSLR